VFVVLTGIKSNLGFTLAFLNVNPLIIFLEFPSAYFELIRKERLNYLEMSFSLFILKKEVR